MHPGPQKKIFQHAHLGKDLLVLRAQGDPFPDDLVGGHLLDPPPGEFNRPLAGLDQSGDIFQQGALPGPVGSQDADELPFLNGQRDAVQGLRPAIKAFNLIDAQQHTCLPDKT